VQAPGLNADGAVPLSRNIKPGGKHLILVPAKWRKPPYFWQVPEQKKKRCFLVLMLEL
jgi:hypothetical protein